MLQDMVREIVKKSRAGGLSLAELIAEVRRQYVTETLEAHRGNQVRASGELAIHRNTLRRVAIVLGVNMKVIRQEQCAKKPVRSVAAFNRKGEHIG